ncbi:MAG: hypothetical protein QOH39_1068 [Verrucomicrobiota bacterium]
MFSPQIAIKRDVRKSLRFTPTFEKSSNEDWRLSD